VRSTARRAAAADDGIAVRSCERHAQRKIAKVNASSLIDIQEVNRRHPCRRK
jgi:hypothetical protein